MDTAAAADEVLERTTRRGDVGSPSGCDQRFGDIDSAAFGASRDQSRDDLQNRRRATFW
jgi:hypothetical protein